MKTGYTLPVFAIAAAKAAILRLANPSENLEAVYLDLLDAGLDSELNSRIGKIAIAQSAPLDQNTALGMTISDPGDNLDLTAGTPVWAWVQLYEISEASANPEIILEAGEGLGKTITGEPAIYKLAKTLAQINLLHLLPPHTSARIKFILPEGRSLAKRTSNAAFGILEGLALLGTRAVSQPLSVEDKLEEFRANLQVKARQNPDLVFYIGANGYQTAQNMGFSPDQLVQTANWIGVMLIEAALLNVNSITLVGYHGKLLKLAGGIFNTSSHLADGRIDILTRAAVHAQLPIEIIQQIERSPTAEAVHKLLITQGLDQVIFKYLTDQISQKAQAYIQKYTGQTLEVKVFLCDRHSQLILDN
ncbi:cobalamin biosynthesis protein CbiD [Synechococcus sp. PCC 7502]|uniref:cobalt-precorrin-5B (C(1))-methyltransferase CbiD n=1 Tax=Synechococcus sp. PCC 7502 TaxID=1173263 RepID=UPI00029FA6D6|nr:cobalt-precorrin-5B (C(1))-methyltransferase CbiD [Synechococcus sp. PCC 7502]AFY73964.1 cobalamin biosynthesis protein CbiD [Synechococcus sp. PCC 7502]